MGIRFGTDGWRGIIAGDFTFANVARIAQAMADTVAASGSGTGVAVGYDTRFLSAEFARTIAGVIASNDIPVRLATGFVPTPVLSFAVAHHRLDAGIMVTASHNPPRYNGVKFKGAHGGPALPAQTAVLEVALDRQAPRHDDAAIRRHLSEVDLWPDYANHLRRFLRLDLLERLSGALVVDAMFGAGIGAFASFLSEAVTVTALRSEINPGFGGMSPEPIPAHLHDLAAAVREHGAFAGIATDGDADRIGLVDERGRFVELHDLMPLLYRHLRRTRPDMRGAVVRTTSMHDTIDRIAAADGVAVHEVPVGFRNVCERMLAEPVLIGGEESGGFGYAGHLPERDGVLTGLLALELLAESGRPLGELVDDLRTEFGAFAYRRIDRHGDPDVIRHNLTVLRAAPPGELGGFPVARVSTVDGLKLYIDNGAWLLMRASDTEPLGRVYVGGPGADIVDALVTRGADLLCSTRL